MTDETRHGWLAGWLGKGAEHVLHVGTCTLWQGRTVRQQYPMIQHLALLSCFAGALGVLCLHFGDLPSG